MFGANVAIRSGKLTRDRGHYDLLYKFDDFQNILSRDPQIRLVQKMPEPALYGNFADPWSFPPDVMTFIPGISYTGPVDASFYGDTPANLLLPGPDLPRPPPPPPEPAFRRSVWQDDVDYDSYLPIEPCTTEPMKQ